MPDVKKMFYINGKRLKEIRERKGFRQKHLSQITGIKPVYISNYERGQMKKASMDNIEKIALVLGVTTNELIVKDDETTSCQDNKDWVDKLKDAISGSNNLQDIEKIESEIRMVQHLLEAKKIEVKIYHEE